MIRIIANVTFATIVVSSLSGCWWFYITFGFVILFLAWSFAQVRMLVMRRRRIAILVTTFVVCVSFVCASLFTRGSSAMLAKRNFSFIFFIAGFPARFRFKIRSVCSLSFFVRTIRSVFLPIRRRQFLSLKFVWVVLFFFRTCERRCFKTKLSCMLVKILRNRSIWFVLLKRWAKLGDKLLQCPFIRIHLHWGVESAEFQRLSNVEIGRST